MNEGKHKQPIARRTNTSAMLCSLQLVRRCSIRHVSRGSIRYATSRSSAIAMPATTTRVVWTPATAVAAAAAAVAVAGTGAALCGTSTAQPASALKAEMMKLSVVAEADKDGDGSLTQQEIDDLFAKLDTNHDGQLTMDEWLASVDRAGLTKEKREQAVAVFGRLDKDGSGAISAAEFKDALHADYLAR